MIAGPTSVCRHGPAKPKLGQIDPIDEDINNPHRVVLANVILNAFGKQKALTPVQTFHIACHDSPPNHGGNASDPHRFLTTLTQSGGRARGTTRAGKNKLEAMGRPGRHHVRGEGSRLRQPPLRPSGSRCRGLVGGMQAPGKVAAAAVARRRCGAWWAYRCVVLIWVCPSSTPISLRGVPRLASTEVKECPRSAVHPGNVGLHFPASGESPMLRPVHAA